MSELHDVPSVAQIVEAVREWLERDVMTGTTGRLQFHARVAVNMLSTVERELASGGGPEAEHSARLQSLGVANNDELARAIREGTLDERMSEVIEAVRADVLAKLAVANPGYVSPK